MRLVIDTNRIIAALIKEGAARDILRRHEAQFYTVEHALSTSSRYRQDLYTRMNVDERTFDQAVTLVMSIIHVIPEEQYAPHIHAATKALGHVDMEDVPFLALAIALNVDIWSNDKHLQQQHLVKVWTTTALLEH